MDLDFLSENADIIVPFGTFFLGFLMSRFTMEKKQKEDTHQTRYITAKELRKEQSDLYDDFHRILSEYISKEEDPDLNDFFEISRAGDKYLEHQKIVSNAILSNRVDQQTRDENFIPSLKETVDKLLPQYYETLSEISEKVGANFDGELKRHKYESIYSVVEKFGTAPSRDENLQ